MTDERTGRELTPRPEEPASAVTPRESDLPTRPESAVGERFSAGEQAHTVGLTEERAAKIVKQSGNARMVAFLGVLFLVLFIPIYWLYDIGLPVIGDQGRLAQEAQNQQVTDVSQGYALFLANCARCHGDRTARAASVRVLNDQGKLYNTVTAAGAPGPGHLNPNYINNVLTVGGRYVCGDPNSVMPVWAQPNGPLNYRQIQQIIAWITASKDVTFTYAPTAAEGAAGATAPPPTQVSGWRDPNYTPPPDATPVPACWKGDNSEQQRQRPSSRGAGHESRYGRSSARDRRRGHRPAEVGRSDHRQPADLAGGRARRDDRVQGRRQQRGRPQLPHRHSDRPGRGAASPTTCRASRSSPTARRRSRYTVPSIVPTNSQFACTVPGHYQSGMHVDLDPAGRERSFGFARTVGGRIVRSRTAHRRLRLSSASPPPRLRPHRRRRRPDGRVRASARRGQTPRGLRTARCRRLGMGTIKATFWFVFIIFVLGYVPDRAYYFTVSPTVDLGFNAISPVNMCPSGNETLPCPAPAGAVVPWQSNPLSCRCPAGTTAAGTFSSGTNLYLIGGSTGGRPRPMSWHDYRPGRQPRSLDAGSGAARRAFRCRRSDAERRSICRGWQ